MIVAAKRSRFSGIPARREHALCHLDERYYFFPQHRSHFGAYPSAFFRVLLPVYVGLVVEQRLRGNGKSEALVVLDDHRAHILAAPARCAREQDLVNLAPFAALIPGVAGRIQQNSHRIPWRRRRPTPSPPVGGA